MSPPAPPPSRQQLRLQSIAWALGAGLLSLGLGLPLGLEAALRAGGCGLFYGLLAFHLQRVDPDDSHLQAVSDWPEGQPWQAALVTVAPTVIIGLIRAWLPLIGAALLLHLSLHLLRHRSRLVAHRVLSARRP
ncbi:MAG: hypothetical protein K0U63_00095 [Cyanobacteria bacterium]|nr:hypothetical protein [Cyanobacteriota bacterium]